MVLHFSSDMQKTGLTEKQRLSLHCFHVTWFLSWKTISGGLVQNKSIKRRVCVRREWNPPVRFIPLCEVCCSHAALKCNPCPITALSLTRGRGWKQKRWSEASKCLFLRFTDSYRVVVFSSLLRSTLRHESGSELLSKHDQSVHTNKNTHSSQQESGVPMCTPVDALQSKTSDLQAGRQLLSLSDTSNPKLHVCETWCLASKQRLVCIISVLAGQVRYLCVFVPAALYWLL